MSSQIKILVVVGSLRRGSYNAMLARAAVDLAADDATFAFADIDHIPPFNADIRDAQGMPEPVLELRSAIAEADAVLVVSPEYNHSIPGVLKNAIDWASDGADHPFKGKPMAITGTSPGRFGTVLMQRHLRDVLGGLGAYVLPKPEVMVAEARSKFDADGRLTDERSQRQVRALVAALAAWAERVAP